MSKYLWKLKSLAKGIDANEAVKELERIESVYGKLTAEHILSESRDPQAVLHPIFNWDDEQAAEQYRLNQARTILNNIQVKTITNGEPKLISVYEVVNKGENRTYKNIESMSPSDVDYVKKVALRELNSAKQKLERFEQFNESVGNIEQAIEGIE